MEIEMIFCRGCGKEIHETAPMCPHCGFQQMERSSTVKNGRNKIVAALLAFFLGGFGVHKFYLGQTGLGIVYLIFCLTFIPAIVAFIESIMFIAMSDEKFDLKYGQY
jgi:TM2 domain-containing membrane protein YozV